MHKFIIRTSCGFLILAFAETKLHAMDEEERARRTASLPSKKVIGKVGQAVKDSGDSLVVSGDILSLHKDGRAQVAGSAARVSGNSLKSSGDALLEYAGLKDKS